MCCAPPTEASMLAARMARDQSLTWCEGCISLIKNLVFKGLLNLVGLLLLLSGDAC
jgi:hypothetical protein